MADASGPARVTHDVAGKLLLSAAGPRMRPLLELALPTFERFAACHGYTLAVADVDDRAADRQGRRQVRWAKLALLRDALGAAETVVWLDADTMVCRFDRDVADAVPAGCFHGLALERFPTRINPNTGVWAVRRGPQAAAFLDAVEDTGMVHHAWSDQAAVCLALGWSLGDYHGHGAHPARPSRWRSRTAWLSSTWNAIGAPARSAPRIRHFAGLPLGERRRRMASQLRRLEATGRL